MNTLCEQTLEGLVTDRDLQLAEQEFPGICRFHEECRGKHRTFLDLLAAFISWCPAQQH
jgi:hypothetical protein